MQNRFLETTGENGQVGSTPGFAVRFILLITVKTNLRRYCQCRDKTPALLPVAGGLDRMAARYVCFNDKSGREGIFYFHGEQIPS